MYFNEIMNFLLLFITLLHLLLEKIVVNSAIVILRKLSVVKIVRSCFISFCNLLIFLKVFKAAWVLSCRPSFSWSCFLWLSFGCYEIIVLYSVVIVIKLLSTKIFASFFTHLRLLKLSDGSAFNFLFQLSLLSSDLAFLSFLLFFLFLLFLLLFSVIPYEDDISIKVSFDYQLLVLRFLLKPFKFKPSNSIFKLFHNLGDGILVHFHENQYSQ